MKNKAKESRLRRSFLVLPVVGVLALVGCSAAGEEVPAGESANGFSFAFPLPNETETFYQDLAQKYMDETGVEIEILPVPGDAAGQQMQTEFQAGNAADLVVVPPGRGNVIGVASLAEAGLLAPLNEVSASTIPAGTEGLYTVDGQVYGQPTSLSVNSLIWSNTNAEAAGIAAPGSFEELLTACETVGDGSSLFAIAGSAPPNLGFLAQTISATRVYAETPDWNEQRAAGTVSFADSDGWKQVLNDFVAMNNAGCFQDGAAGGNFDSISNGLVSGSAITASIPSGAATALNGASQGKADIVVQPFPAAGEGEQYVIASALMAFVSNGASDPSVQLAVQEFLEWADQPAEAAAFAESSGSIPTVTQEGSALLPIFEPVSDIIADKRYFGEPNLSWPNAGVYEALGIGMQGLLTGQTTVDSTLASMDAAWGS